MKWLSIVLIVALSACSTTTPQTRTVATVVAAPHAALPHYHSFSFGLSDAPKVGYEVTPRSLEVQRRLRSIVLTALEQRGYVANDAQGDLVVKLATGTGPEIFQHVDKGAERAIPSGLASAYIGINIYDGSSGAEVWQGSAFAEIDPSKIDDTLLQTGVAHMLQDFPSKDQHSVVTVQ